MEGKCVSRCHCILSYNAERNTYILTDLSSNGTYLAGGQRLPKGFAAELAPGTEIFLAEPSRCFRLG